jgi:hypothetical protein
MENGLYSENYRIVFNMIPGNKRWHDRNNFLTGSAANMRGMKLRKLDVFHRLLNSCFFALIRPMAGQAGAD